LVGYAFNPGNWTIEIDGEWVEWATAGETFLSFQGESDPSRLAVLNIGNPTKRDWHNTWNLGIGTNYKFNETWQARIGYFYFPNVIPEDNWEPRIPEGTRNGFAFGGSFSQSSFSLDFVYNFAHFAKRTVHNNVGADSLSSIDGEYSSTAHVISTNLTYYFSAEK